MTATRPRWTSWLIATAKVAVLALMAYFIYRAFIEGNQALDAHSWQAEPLWLVVAALLYLSGIFPGAVFWQRVLRETGQDVHLGEAVRAFYVSQLGKYVPGKWMVILLRRVLLTSPNVETTVIAASVFFETFTTMAVGSTVSALVLIIWHPDKWMLIVASIGAIFLMGVPTVPVCFRWLLHTLGVTRLNPTAGAKFRQITPRTLALGWLMLSVGWCLQGMSLWAVLRAMGAAPGGPLVELSLHTTAVALGVVAGFVSQIPGGLLVREWVAGELLEPAYGPSVALVSTVILRLVLLVSELLVSIILYAAGWRRLRKASAAARVDYHAAPQR